jgi:hypothetical protein
MMLATFGVITLSVVDVIASLPSGADLPHCAGELGGGKKSCKNPVGGMRSWRIGEKVAKT